MVRHFKRHNSIIAVLIAGILLLAGAFLPTGQVRADNSLPSAHVLAVQVTYEGVHQPDETFRITALPQEAAPQAQEGTAQEVSLTDHTTKGEVSFTYDFDTVGTYTYQVRQETGSTEGITYDTSVYTVTFDVYQDAAGLKSVMRVQKEGEEASKPAGITFENTFTPTGIAIGDPPVVRKVIDGETNELHPFVFTFTPLHEGQPMQENAVDGVCTVTVKGEGAEEFGDIVFSEPGVYEYEIKERNDQLTGYTYDETYYRVIYTVSDEGGGALKCERVMLKNNYESSSECQFTNQYDPTAADKKGRTGRGTGKRALSAKTGDLIEKMVYLLLAVSVVTLVIAFVRRKRREHA